MKKLKIIGEIFGKSFLFLAVAITSLLMAVYTETSLQEQGLSAESISLTAVTAGLFVMIIWPPSPFSHHNLICKPAEARPSKE